MRRAARVDKPQSKIVAALRAYGCSVTHLHQVGNGCPDILCGYRGRTLLMELKDGTKPPSERKLTPDQETWAAEWKGGPLWVIKSTDEAIQILRQIDA